MSLIWRPRCSAYRYFSWPRRRRCGSCGCGFAGVSSIVTTPHPATFEPLRIGGLLIAMAVIGMALAAAQASQSLTARSGDRSIAGLVVAALVIMVISAITVLPAVLAGLHARRLPLALGLAFAADVVSLWVTWHWLWLLGAGD